MDTFMFLHLITLAKLTLKLPHGAHFSKTMDCIKHSVGCMKDHMTSRHGAIATSQSCSLEVKWFVASLWVIICLSLHVEYNVIDHKCSMAHSGLNNSTRCICSGSHLFHEHHKHMSLAWNSFVHIYKKTTVVVGMPCESGAYEVWFMVLTGLFNTTGKWV